VTKKAEALELGFLRPARQLDQRRNCATAAKGAGLGGNACGGRRRHKEMITRCTQPNLQGIENGHEAFPKEMCPRTSGAEERRG